MSKRMQLFLYLIEVKEMTVIRHDWEILKKQTVRSEVKHCKMCGRNSTFTDTNIRRHNSNGKHIYRFAIYKCEKNHTWNKKLDIYKAFRKHEKVYGREPIHQKSILTEIPVHLYLENRVSEVHIMIKSIEGVYRIDSLLSQQIPDWSRTAVVDKIKSGSILINDQCIKPSMKVMLHDTIMIKLD